ncbi:hypothetical protein Bbelb_104100 [Branchiostoma belcheri]|nr:hypothetical protein Bbelb_104100 [Branchiostoma belcheri]
MAVCKPKCGGNGGAKNVQGITAPTRIYLNFGGLKHNVNIPTRRLSTICNVTFSGQSSGREVLNLHTPGHRHTEWKTEGSNLTLISRRGDPQYKVCFCGIQVRCMVDLISVTMSVAGIVFGVAAKFSPLENGDFPMFC